MKPKPSKYEDIWLTSISIPFLIVIMIMAFYVGIHNLGLPTGFATYDQTMHVVDDANFLVNSNDEISVSILNGNVTGLGISGTINRSGSVDLWISDGSNEYLVFDSNENDMNIVDEIPYLKTEPTIEDSQKEGNISVNLIFSDNPGFDIDNNGIEFENGVIDLEVQSQFNFNVSVEHLCTKWIIHNIESEESTIICNGAEECCALLELSPTNTEWDNPLYVNYGKYGAGYRNIVSAQIIYADYNLDPDNPYSNIVYSDKVERIIYFVDENIILNNVCGDACDILNLGRDFILEFNVENSYVNIDEISYELGYVDNGEFDTINVTYLQGSDETHSSFDIETQEISLGLMDMSQGTPILNATDHPLNTSSANLTAYNVSSVNVTKNIYNWFVDGNSITVLNMPFENHSGDVSSDALDYSGHGNDGSVVNDASWNSTGGYEGFGAYEFDGYQDYVQIPYDSSLELSEYTISTWVKINSTPNPSHGVLGTRAGGEYTFNFKVRDNRIKGDIGSGSSWITTAADCYIVVPIGDWYHIVYVVNTSGWQIFVNGTYCNGSTYSGTPKLMKSGETLRIGHTGYTDVEYMNGSIDEVIIFNRSLSAEQIKAIYENRTDLIVSQETNTGEVWSVNITPNDGIEDGISLRSNDLMISEIEPPTLLLYSPLNQQAFYASTVLVNFNATDTSNISTLWYYNGSANRTFTTAENITLINGLHSFVFYANDSFGNINSQEVEFLVDNDTNNWPQFKKNLYGTSVYPGNINMNNFTKLWNFTTIIRTQPTVSNGIVYIGSLDNNTYALNATTGNQIWNYTAGDWVDTSPAVSNGIVYIGSYDNNTYALNATTGNQIWNY
ncbi:LamG-like jellyroll fold domain-containing protein, partial [Nanoarchaeota archaeon]